MALCANYSEALVASTLALENLNSTLLELQVSFVFSYRYEEFFTTAS